MSTAKKRRLAALEKTLGAAQAPAAPASRPQQNPATQPPLVKPTKPTAGSNQRTAAPAVAASQGSRIPDGVSGVAGPGPSSGTASRGALPGEYPYNKIQTIIGSGPVARLLQKPSNAAGPGTPASVDGLLEVLVKAESSAADVRATLSQRTQEKNILLDNPTAALTAHQAFRKCGATLLYECITLVLSFLLVTPLSL